MTLKIQLHRTQNSLSMKNNWIQISLRHFHQLTLFLSECSKSGNQIADHITSTYYGQCVNIFISEKIIFYNLLNDMMVSAAIFSF